MNEQQDKMDRNRVDANLVIKIIFLLFSKSKAARYPYQPSECRPKQNSKDPM